MFVTLRSGLKPNVTFKKPKAPFHHWKWNNHDRSCFSTNFFTVVISSNRIASTLG